MIGYNEIQASVSTGYCTNASNGQYYAKCEMKCKSDGTCTETLKEEYCGCDGTAQFVVGYTTWEVRNILIVIWSKWL